MRCDALRAVSCAPGESRAEVGRKSGGGPDPVFVPHRSLRGRPPPAQGAARAGFAASAGPLRLRVLFCGSLCDSGIRTLSCGPLCGCVCFSAGSSAVPASAPCPASPSAVACAFLRVSLRLRHLHPVLRASLRRRVLFCGLLCGSGIRTLSCERLCGGVCFAAALSAVRAAGLRPLLCLLFCGPFVQRGADAAFFAPCGPRLRRVSRIGGPPSRLALTARLPASLRRPGVFAAPVGGRGRPVRFRPSPGPVPPTARAAAHSGRRRGIAALPSLSRPGGRCESSVIIRKCTGDGIVE